MSDRIYIIDTNVVVAGLITAEPESPTSRVLDAMLDGSLLYILAEDLLREYRNVLLRPKITRRHGLSEQQIDQFLSEIAANAAWREVPPDANLPSPDPRDAHLWALLASAPAAILITGDRLLIENPMPQRSIISPAVWAEHFNR
ncbi:MAG: putative toxin-antitoxin system toxin component, PIN family [Desulfobacterales bacterium]|nr:putative toxin-antitoxin system toxin component, PIN family [Desulfobacterales bacterium]